MLWIGSGRFDGRIGDGNGPRACRGPDAGIGPSAWADGTVRQLAATLRERWSSKSQARLDFTSRGPKEGASMISISTSI